MADTLIDAARRAMNAGQQRQATEIAQTRLAADPHCVDAIEILALAAGANGDGAGAERHFRHILSIDPGAIWARTDLARLLIAGGRPAEAEVEIRLALAANPAHADAHAMLGALLSEREQAFEGAVHLRRAMDLVGPHPQILMNLARNLLRRGALEEAAELASQASPERLETAVLLAEIAERRDDFDAAYRALDHAERLAAREGRDVLLLRATLLSRTTRWAEGLALLDGQATLNGAARLLRGRLRDKAARHDEAWSDFVAGKAALAHASGRRYDREAVEAHFGELAAVSLAGLPAADRHEGVQPLFILGMPRSGTTLIEQVLSSHPMIRAGGELPFTPELRDFAGRMLGNGHPFPSGIGRLAAADHHHLPNLFRDFYLARAGVYGLTVPGASFFTDKMPANETYLPLLRLAFPHAPMVAVRRHPLDTLVSIMAHDMTHGFDCGYRPEDAAHHLAAVSALTRAYDATIPSMPLDLRYERMIADQDGETSRLMAHASLRVDPAQKRFHENPRHAPTPSYAQVREPLHDRSIGRWKNYRTQLEPIMPLLETAMASYGYSL